MSVEYAKVMRGEVPFVVAAPEEPPAPEVAANEHSVLGLTELLLKDPDRVDRLAREQDEQPFLIPRFLAVGLTSFSLFALALVLTLGAAPAGALPWPLAATWAAHPTEAGLALWLAYALGFTLTTGVCLPSFYFYALLAGVRVSWLQVTAQVMRGQGATAIMLLGILPVYLAVALGAIVFGAPPEILKVVLAVALLLPFGAGLWGVRAIYIGFLGLSDTLPPERRCQRECWLRRLTAACSACYTAICPLMIYTLWNYFADHLTRAGL
jgi:hypothetical protein